MTRIQCTGCGQVFWAELQLDESLVGPGEWVQNECPKCGAKWATIEPKPGGSRRGRARRAKPGPKRGGRPRRTIQAKAERTPAKEKEGAPGFSAAGIRKMRKKLAISQKKFASLVGVSIGTIVGWESGKYKPRAEKVAKLSELEKGDNPSVGNIPVGSDGKQASPEKSDEGKAEQAQLAKRPKAAAKKGSSKRKGGRSSRRPV